MNKWTNNVIQLVIHTNCIYVPREKLDIRLKKLKELYSFIHIFSILWITSYSCHYSISRVTTVEFSDLVFFFLDSHSILKTLFHFSSQISHTLLAPWLPTVERRCWGLEELQSTFEKQGSAPLSLWEVEQGLSIWSWDTGLFNLHQYRKFQGHMPAAGSVK